MKVASVVCSGTQSIVVCEFGGRGVIFRPGRGMNDFWGFNFTCMHCGDLNSAHNDFLKVYLVSIY